MTKEKLITDFTEGNNSYGVAVSAFAGIANKINSTTNLISNAFNTAGSSMVGQNIGAKNTGV